MLDVAGDLETTSSKAVDTVNLQAADQPRQESNDKQSWAEAINAGGPLELDDLCWFYLDPFVCPTALACA